MELFYGPTDKSHEPFVPSRPMVGFKASEQGLGHVVLRVPDRDACERFYVDVLGLHLSDYGSGRLAFFHCNARHHSIAIAPADQMPGPRRIIHIMLEALSLDDLGTSMDLCEQNGVPMLETLGKHPNDWMVSFYLETPSKFGIEYGFGGRDIDEATWEVRRYEKRDLWGHRRLTQPAGTPAGSH
jgi:2,3-dihydroxybiphenyl 1,2-dioxygenase